MNFKFDGGISREVLNNYLSHAVSHAGLCGESVTHKGCVTESQTFEDDLRMLKKEGAKFIGRAAKVWGVADEAQHIAITEKRCARAHEIDPDMVIQGCVFESIYPNHINNTPIPGWVFKAFDLPAEERPFNYEAMLFPDGKFVNHWKESDTAIDSAVSTRNSKIIILPKCGSVEDITQLESQMWIYYKACAYIKAGCEGIHFGQVHLIGAHDEGFKCWKKVIDMIRAFAKVHARRHYVLCDAHTHGITVNGVSLFDYNCYPLRLKEIEDRPQQCQLEEGYYDSIYGRSLGGYSPSGWYADSLPFMVEFDEFGPSDHVGKPAYDHFAWGMDEISYFKAQSGEYRRELLTVLDAWLKARYPEGWLQMPSRRYSANLQLTVTTGNPTLLNDICAHEYPYIAPKHIEGNTYEVTRGYYNANNPSDDVPFGFGDEDTIQRIFSTRKDFKL